MEFSHVSVLLHQSVDALNITPGGIYADGTMGGGGHSEAILQQLGGTGLLLGIDRDEEALAASRKRLESHQNVRYIHDNFSNIRAILEENGIEALSGAVLDLGVSSYQIDNPERGFSYMENAPLDMRMDRSGGMTAYDVVNGYDERRLADVIYQYGEERFSRKIAHLICAARADKPLQTTAELCELIRRAVPERSHARGSHAAKRTFQAIRIEVNGELEILKQAMEDFFDALAPGGRLAVITFHSLEDRAIKTAFASFTQGCTCPKDFPVCVCGNKPRGRLVSRKPILPDENEMTQNSRSRSAKLRVIEKL